MSETQLSFESDIRSLFRPKDRNSMRRAFDLWSYSDVSTRSDGILNALKSGSMPCDGAWPAEQLALFERWIAEGKPE